MDLMSIGDIAKRWDISHQRAHKIYQNDANFPKPLGTVSGGKMPIFDLSEIKKFEKVSGRGQQTTK